MVKKYIARVDVYEIGCSKGGQVRDRLHKGCTGKTGREPPTVVYER